MKADPAQLRRSLLVWYRKNRRKLPWRAAPGKLADPYHVLVSETMLQQTQVATVVPYFHRFIRTFPTLDDLAAADESQVLHLWQGLGYYRRAKHLHAAAKTLVQRHNGQLPRTVEGLLELPGVGRYTAGAIASIAFAIPAPILDGNVARVVARLFAVDQPIDEPAVRKQLWSIARSLVPAKNPGDLNQSLMELGATVCTPLSPACLFCPVAPQCAALTTHRVSALPARKARKKPMDVVHHVLVIRDNRDRLVVEQRPATGLWASLWQFPTLESAATLSQLVTWCKNQLGLTVKNPQRFDRFNHATTHRAIAFHVWQTSIPTSRAATVGRDLRWRSLRNISELPMSNPQRKIVGLLEIEKSKPRRGDAAAKKQINRP